MNGHLDINLDFHDDCSFLTGIKRFGEDYGTESYFGFNYTQLGIIELV